ncbi:hypothetical protein C8J48_2402 [Desmospora activa DSM 45169]|uniref:Uncharacterized protein n=1 Tax=Desmospora activa DSM 45169 TaxID=1121389 RepID=A0A2T4ZD04_9BACL|nr:hypothetical protein C8J48_2402 [Desmospora activa DSM 45169]
MKKRALAFLAKGVGYSTAVFFDEIESREKSVQMGLYRRLDMG